MESILSIMRGVHVLSNSCIGFLSRRANLLKKTKVLCTRLVWPAVRPSVRASVRAFGIHDHAIISARSDKTSLMHTKEKSGQTVTSLQSKVCVLEVGGRLGEIVNHIHHAHANAKGTS